MDIVAANFRKLIEFVSALPVPEQYSRKAFTLPASRQLGMALVLNLLSLAAPLMMLQVYDRIIPHKSYGTLIMLIAGVLVALAFDATIRIIRAWLVTWAAASNEHAASCAALDHCTRADLATFEQTSTGVHMQSLSALSRLREFHSGQALSAMIDLPFAGLFLALIAYLGGILFLVPLGLLVVFFFMAVLTGRMLKRVLSARSDADDHKSSVVISILTGIHTLKALGMETPMLRRYEAEQSAVTGQSYQVALASGVAGTLSAAFGQLSLILTATAGAVMVLHGNMSVGSLSACTMLAGRCIQPVQRVLGTWLRLQDLGVAREQAQALFALPARPAARGAPGKLPGNIVIEKATLKYPGADKPLLRDIFLEINEGDVVAISGAKSSGKSSLLQMIAGVVTPTSGRVRIEGIDPAQFGLTELSGTVGYMPQEGTIFRGTLLENITGFRGDEYSIARAKEACAELALDDVADLLPYGYQTPLTDTQADPIPPGVKQRVALTRVLMHQPSVLLFDDADRALDKEGYNRLFRVMGRLKRSCTMVLVSHDQNLLSFADHFYHLEEGVLKRSMGPAGSNLSPLLRDGGPA